MTLVGFKQARIQPFDKDGKPDGDVIVIQGKKDNGATTSAEIEGLSKEVTTVAGSDIAYYISRKGIGQPKIDFGILDLPEAESDRLLGYKKDEDSGIVYLGNETEAPYCSVILDSSTLQGVSYMLGFFRGVFSKDKVSMKTLDPNENFTPEADTYTFTAAASDASDASAGNYAAKYVGKDAESIAAFEKQILGVAEEDPKI